MVKQILLFLGLLIMFALPAYAVELDQDSNNAIDIQFGGTNATTAGGARSNLGLAIGSDVQAYDVDLASLASGITGIVKGSGDGGGYAAATLGTDIPGLGTTNAFTGTNSWSGQVTLGNGSNQVLIITRTIPYTDTWDGPANIETAGEDLSQWDLVYNRISSGVSKWFKYDANDATEYQGKEAKYFAPRGIALAAITAGSTGLIGYGDGKATHAWGQTANQDEGKDVYASTTPGLITLSAPGTQFDQVVRVGYVMDANTIQFSLGNAMCLEVP